MIRFECGSEDLMSEAYGPFEYVQLVYTDLTTTDGKILATFYEGFWYLQDGAFTWHVKDLDIGWSDVVIFSQS
jgi:hypothetical protein